MSFVGINESLKKELEKATGKEIYVENVHFRDDILTKEKWKEISSRKNSITFLNGATLKSFKIGHNMVFDGIVKIFGDEIELDTNQGDMLDFTDAKFKNILLDENKKIIGDIDGNIIAFIIDLFHSHNNQREILIYALNKSGFIKNNDAKRLYDLGNKFALLFVKTVNDFKFKELKTLEGNLKYNQQDIDNLRRSIDSKFVQMHDIIRKLKAYEKIKEVEASSILEEIEKVAKLPFVKSVRQSKEKLTICFDDVWFTVIGKKLRIGKYSIHIDKNGCFSVWHELLGKDRKNNLAKYHQHLHITHEGHVCLGNYSSLFNNIQDGQLEYFAVSMWDFLNFPRDLHGFVKIENFLKLLECVQDGEKIPNVHIGNDYCYADIKTLKVDNKGRFTIEWFPNSESKRVTPQSEVEMGKNIGETWEPAKLPKADAEEEEEEESDEW